jgi:hypothetical protein
LFSSSWLSSCNAKIESQHFIGKPALQQGGRPLAAKPAVKRAAAASPAKAATAVEGWEEFWPYD